MALGGIALLVVLAIPFAHVEFASPDSTVLPATNPARQVTRSLTTNFDDNPADQLDVIVPTVDRSTV